MHLDLVYDDHYLSLAPLLHRLHYPALASDVPFFHTVNVTMAAHGHRQTGSVSQNHKAQLASAYNELGKELSSQKIRVIGNYTLGKVIGEGAYTLPLFPLSS